MRQARAKAGRAPSEAAPAAPSESAPDVCSVSVEPAPGEVSVGTVSVAPDGSTAAADGPGAVTGIDANGHATASSGPGGTAAAVGANGSVSVAHADSNSTVGSNRYTHRCRQRCGFGNVVLNIRKRRIYLVCQWNRRGVRSKRNGSRRSG